jgi:hypothetical protein
MPIFFFLKPIRIFDWRNNYVLNYEFRHPGAIMFRTLTAQQIVRKMRGGAQAHLVRTEGNEFFVAKAPNNPQHLRTLTNEAIGAVLLRQLGICVPEAALISVPAEVLMHNAFFELGERRTPLQPGIYFGSRYPGDPAQVAVYDFMPKPLPEKVVNAGDFLGALVFDKWACNTDGRQAVFCRSNTGFRAYMIDQGYIFAGAEWQFYDAPLYGLYPFPAVYERVKSMDDFEPWLDRARHFPESVIDEAYRAIPAEWIDGSRPDLESLLDRLVARRARIPELLLDCRLARPSLFPNWSRRLARPMGTARGRRLSEGRRVGRPC